MIRSVVLIRLSMIKDIETRRILRPNDFKREHQGEARARPAHVYVVLIDSD